MADIYWIGDSTVQFNSILTYPQTGMGQVLNLYLDPSVRVYNHAKNGRSTKSFMEQGRFEPVKEKIKEGDFLFISFAHNDEKETDPLRYTTPFGTYKEFLRVYINTAREKKAYPVLITPIERRCFEEDGKLGPGMHGEYVQALKEVSEELNVPVIDLYTKSRELLNKLGPVDAAKLHLVVPAGVYPHFPEGMDDMTHLCYEGAVTYCGIIADGLRALGGVYESLLLDPEKET